MGKALTGTVQEAVLNAALIVTAVNERDALLAERDALRAALAVARSTLVAAMRSAAPGWFDTDADLKTHVTIKAIDSALALSSGER